MDKDKKNSVLIVGCENSSIMKLTDILSPEYAVYETNSCHSAIKMTGELLPDVILIDILKPEIDGNTVIAELKNSENTRNIPIIIIIGPNDAGGEEKGLVWGAADYITKPLNAEIVKLRVKNQIKIINQIHLAFEKKLTDTISRVRFEFLSHMSHKMLTPINAIIGMTEMTKRLGGSGEIKEYLNEIDIASRQLLDFINDLLGISGDKSGALALTDSDFLFEQLLHNVLKEISPNAGEKK